MIKKLYKKIKLFFIDRKIKKIHNDILDLRKQLQWVKKHMHDMSIHESLKYIKAINTQLKLCKMELDSYNEDKERLINNGLK